MIHFHYTMSFMNSSLIYHDHCFADLVASVPSPLFTMSILFPLLEIFNFGWLLINQTGFSVMGLNA